MAGLTREEQALLDAGKRHLPFPPLGGWYTEEEVEAITRVLRESMDWKKGFGGPDVAQFERQFAAYCDVKHAIAFNSCGTGLDVAMQALDLGPDDEVIVPAITYIATAQCVIGVGARVVLAEIDPQTFNIDPHDVERKMSPRTRAILPVHNNGLSVDMDALIEIAERHPHAQHGPVPVIGDAARACGGGYRGTRVGKRGAMNVFSFQTSKNMTTLGEGGLITTDDDAYARYARSARSFGWELKGWGTNYRMTRLQGVTGSIQLRRLDTMNEARRARIADFASLLQDIPGVTLPTEPAGYHHVWYGYTMLLDRPFAGAPRDKIVDRLARQYGITAWVMNASLGDYDTVLNKLGHTPEQTPVSTDAGRRLLCPPVHPHMDDEDLRYIAAALKASIESVAAEAGIVAALA